MNKTLSIALAGFSFVIDEHAYIKLGDYLAALRRSLDPAEADEVMHDIEIRMVEIFKDSLGKREVIYDADVEKVIAQIGTPEQIDEQEEAYFADNKINNSNNSQAYASNSQKQLFRDPEKQKIAGVCAGLAAYFGMDITWMRLIWIAAFVFLWVAPGSSFLIILLYFILWAVVPKAETASDFLKMKGKPINFDNIKEESSKIVQFANETATRAGEIINENRPKINNTGDTFLKIVKYAIGIASAVFSIGCFIALFTMTFAYSAGKFGIDSKLSFFLEENNLGYLILAIAALPTLILGVAFLLLSIKLFSPKTKFNYVGPVLGVLGIIWLILIGILAANASKFNLIYSGENEDYENVSIPVENDTIYLATKKVVIPENFQSYFDNVYSDKKSIYKKDWPSVEITRRDDIKSPYLVIKKEADGYNIPIKMKVPVEIAGNRIYLPNYYEYPFEYRFRDYRLDYELVVPRNYKIINENTHEIYLRGDDDSDDDDDDDDNNGVVRVKKAINKINIQGTTIEYDSDNSDSIKINGKMYSKDSADIVIERMKIKDEIRRNLKELKINIKAGKNGISIKTN